MSEYDWAKNLERAVMADRDRPCLYGVRGPCQHPKCLDAHFETLRARKEEADKRFGQPHYGHDKDG